MSSQTCLAGSNARARVGRAARSVRLRAPTAAVDTMVAERYPDADHCIEIVLPDQTCAPYEVLGALEDERLDLQDATAQGTNFVVVATA